MFILDALRAKAESAASGLPGLVMKAEAIAASVTHGEHSKRRVGPGEKFWQFRPYDVADRPQDIDWKQTAKSEGTMVREKEWQNPQKILFWCGFHAGMEYSSNPAVPTKHEVGMVLCLALALLMSRAGEQVGLLGERRTGRSELAIEHLAQGFLHSPDMGARPDSEGLPPRAAVVLAGDFWDDLAALEAMFKRFEGRAGQGILLHVVDSAELELPFEGRAIFRAPGLEGPEPIKIEHIGDIRSQYKSRVQDHVQGIQILCRRYGWRYHLCRNNADLGSIVEAIWGEGEGHAQAS